jgi:hypothetical protein
MAEAASSARRNHAFRRRRDRYEAEADETKLTHASLAPPQLGITRATASSPEVQRR